MSTYGPLNPKLLRFAVVFVVTLLALGLAATSTAATRSETRSYTAGGDVLIVDCEGEDTLTGQNIGGVCFDLTGKEASAFINIEDASGLPVGAYFEARDSAGDTVLFGSFCDATVVNDLNGLDELLIWLSTATWGVLECVPDGPGTATTGEVTARFELKGGPGRGGPKQIDVERECLEPLPDSFGIQGITDEGQSVSLDVRVLLDGVTSERGMQVMTRAAEAYAPLGIDLNSTFKTVSFTGDDALGLINQGKQLYRGERPRGVDLVYVLTSKDIQLGGNTGVAGLADCIGGVRFDERAFAVGEDASAVGYENRKFDPLPLTFYLDVTAKIAAHELGHLMGGHHHYANCAEGVTTETTEEASPCTLMFNFVDFQSINISLVNSGVVRGHAVNYASP
ncbi:MAG: hypothetical protein KY429_12140 [Actinobacteria bacterium]|nr:hypothetical protein [Actinomycetota bacterium]